MKKFAMAAVAAAAMTVGVAQAYTVGTFTNGVVVPNVIHNGAADTTAVGLINQTATVVPVFWTFFNQNSGHVTDGCFPMTPKDFQPFVWSAQSGLGLEGQRGYLVFAVGLTPGGITAANACQAANSAGQGPGLIAANAFQVDLANSDVAFVPVIDGDLTIGSDLSTMGPADLTAVGGAFNGAPAATNTLSMRYFVDNTLNGGNETRIVVWSTGDQRGTHTVNMFDDAQNRKSVNFEMKFAELDFFNPETIPGRPAAFVDGFIEWAPFAVTPADYPGVAGQDLATLGGSVFSYSLISAPAFGAVQSVLGAHN
ncbi:MAG: hypothetical protein O9337_22880 [Acidovorax sp.]|uniref:hypothetical protein n=1 Tax=Acidovorax sp. TaxID=1872122 RepID=UPI0022BFF90D|nr:hypothetical protein [Acidovorax sp.]MCZ8222275.1 hypothetical protein [Acidovorax sp.]